MKDLIAARLATGAPIVFEVADVRVDDLDDRPAGRPRSVDDGEPVDAALRRRRRLRRLPRHLPAVDPAGRAARLRPRVPVRLARHPGQGRADHRRADLQPPRPRLRPLQHALARDHPAVPPGAARRGHRRVARRPHLDRAGDPAADGRRLHAARRTDPREGHHRHAQLRGDADALRPPGPRRRRRPHRAADRAPRG